MSTGVSARVWTSADIAALLSSSKPTHHPTLAVLIFRAAGATFAARS